eukprot:CAMPEP_0118993344 /NCGR_PEP_ID=MMETSP1173-20130426/54910_1 /TAXON_ID=1034831 /ORGANISM="Rhizochromulina marina cf, Strain CCMP1243" /LENGTH=385 /DNA_ID=CAMNT_0006944583 /DNA_START=4 /DNA_END=1161 /DNA_ORIENTATION=+
MAALDSRPSGPSLTRRGGKAPTRHGGGPPRPREIELFEIQSRDLLISRWRPANTPWTKKDGAPCEPRELYPLPDNFAWVGNWRVDYSDTMGEAAGARDQEGWEYATSVSKLGPHRVPRRQGMKDHARRRRWVRQMQRNEQYMVAQTSEEKLATIRAGLEMLGKAQREIGKMAQKIGTPRDSMPVRETITEYVQKVKDAQTRVLDHITTLSDEAKAQKLRREYDKIVAPFTGVERSIVQRLQGTPLPEATPSAGPAASAAATQRSRNVVQSGSGGVHFESSSGGGEGAYVSRQQQEQLVLDKLRTLDDQEIDSAIMEERNEAIQAVHTNVTVLNSLFKDMAELVSDQQEAIDQIESNVESAHDKTKQGIGELEQALNHQKKTCVIS